MAATYVVHRDRHEADVAPGCRARSRRPRRRTSATADRSARRAHPTLTGRRSARRPRRRRCRPRRRTVPTTSPTGSATSPASTRLQQIALAEVLVEPTRAQDGPAPRRRRARTVSALLGVGFAAAGERAPAARRPRPTAWRAQRADRLAGAFDCDVGGVGDVRRRGRRRARPPRSSGASQSKAGSARASRSAPARAGRPEALGDPATGLAGAAQDEGRRRREVGCGFGDMVVPPSVSLQRNVTPLRYLVNRGPAEGARRCGPGSLLAAAERLIDAQGPDAASVPRGRGRSRHDDAGRLQRLRLEDGSPEVLATPCSRC